MITVNLKDHPQLKKLVLQAFPGYRKAKAFIHRTTSVRMDDTYWDGGSISHYAFVGIQTGSVFPTPGYAPPQFGGPKVTPDIPVAAGVLCVSTGTFCGKPATAAVYVNPVDADLFFPGVEM